MELSFCLYVSHDDDDDDDEAATTGKEETEVIFDLICFNFHISPQIDCHRGCIKLFSTLSSYRVFFSKGPALKVLSVGDSKIPTKKVKVLVRFSHLLSDIPLLSLFW